ncbi:MAG: hypothetical protein KGQ59_01685 [Bdellovibrionales bacterium]|nr:hypothetical protein [Bdellovibrionales bacterium]
MTSWVHLFSKFTAEALLLEAALICLLIGGFFTYTVLRKRRTGSQEEAVPSSVVKVYLNELITDAEQMRAQLFGLLQSSGIMTPSPENSGAAKAAFLASQRSHDIDGSTSGDSELLHKISTLEARMKEQSRAMELLIQDKSRIENELTLAKNTAAKAILSETQQSPDTTELKRKIAQLEGKLAEYSVIEDDLANLKRLQQENTDLKSRLGSVEKPAATASPSPLVENPEVLPSSSSFDQLAPEVEASLVSAPKTEAEEPKKPSEADLLAEFEKMLNG